MKRIIFALLLLFTIISLNALAGSAQEGMETTVIYSNPSGILTSNNF